MAIIKNMKKILIELIWLFSELESLVSDPNSKLLIRRLFLNFKSVKYGKKLWIGRGFRLLNSDKLILEDV